MIARLDIGGMENEMRDFQIGDIVRLKSGGPKMVLCRVNFSMSNADVVWFSGDEIRFAVVRLEALAFVSEYAVEP